ncbi:L domain-like protein [Paraphaeosphaeria sporulosa]|uniref:L domain-like protein n=1 Tax=Paraphaeosphaeria sporulosa TaxID=1460663 RepID=A0A177CNB6_9PLEO|nr:L domain-like protein [Paraphaeosphaeria sporulosa]OAG08390.1 L domain-like protein [Paraphaeosphaeria sporulosa]
MEQPSGIPRPSSGIPRPTSRLPVLRPAGSQSQLRSTPSTEQLRKKPSLQPPLQKKPSLSSVSRISQPPPSLQKKPSRTSLARSSIVPPASANPSSNRVSVLSTKRSIPSLAGRNSAADAPVFKKPTGRPPSRQTRASVQPAKAHNGAQNDDVLGDLDAFRSASRASSRASSRAGFHETEPQYALDIDEDAPAPAVRKSRPSLRWQGASEVELLQQWGLNGSAAETCLSVCRLHHKEALLSLSERQCLHDRHIWNSQQEIIHRPTSFHDKKAASFSVSKFAVNAKCPAAIQQQHRGGEDAEITDFYCRHFWSSYITAGDFTNANTPKPSSSQALRDQIAKAKAAKRANVTSPPRPRTNTPPRDAIIPDPVEIASFDFGLDDPFNQRPKGASLLRKRVDAARADGRLNLAAMDLDEIPEEVLKMYEYDPEVNTAWGEVVDLTSMIMADNNLHVLPDSMFPYVDYDAVMESEDVVPQFGGILNLDLHGNAFRELPLGLGRLPQLSKLNLSRNKLTTDSLAVVFGITTLRELKLAENQLTGALPSQIENLTSLETLDLQANRLSSLPPEIRALTHLKVLNVAENKLTGLPNDVFTSMPVVDLNASKNSFSGTFFEVETVSNLQTLSLANNQLTSLCTSDTISLPSMKHLDLSMNRLSSLPNMAAWTNLVTLLIGENSLSTFPEGLCSLKQLRNADFTANSINKIDESIALMEGLENLTLAANPLRERKYLTMNAEDIKRDLMSKLDPGVVPDGDMLQDLAGIKDLEAEINGWKLTPSGALDLSSHNMTEVDEDELASFAESHNIKQLYLQQNQLTRIPMAVAQLSFLTVLDLSKNSVTDPLLESLELPKLREIRLGNNKLKSFHAITSKLSAPSLHHLDVSNNKIAGSLPNLRESYPALLTLLASDNGIDEVSAESLEGLKIVSLSNNEIARLEPHIGLLAGTLTSLDVEGNKFRVPNYAVLKKGTDAVLTWLKDKIPSPTDEFDPGSPAF